MSAKFFKGGINYGFSLHEFQPDGSMLVTLYNENGVVTSKFSLPARSVTKNPPAFTTTLRVATSTTLKASTSTTIPVTTTTSRVSTITHTTAKTTTSLPISTTSSLKISTTTVHTATPTSSNGLKPVCQLLCFGFNVGFPVYNAKNGSCKRFFTDSDCLNLPNAKLGGGNSSVRECLVTGGGSYTSACQYDALCCASQHTAAESPSLQSESRSSRVW